MTVLVERAAQPHRELVAALSEGDLTDQAVLSDVLESTEPDRAIRFLAGITTVYAALVGSPVACSDALGWFAPDHRPLAPAGFGWNAIVTDELVGMLPYVLDPFGFTTRRALLSGRGCAVERGKRKAMGTFYTPGDVARYLAQRVLKGDEQRVVDPACGAGVFLRAAFSRLCDSVPASAVVDRLYGVDVDLRAVDACSLVLLHDWLKREPLREEETPVERYLQLRTNLIHGNALDAWARREQLPLFGAVAATLRRLPTQFDAVLTNPPFAPVGEPPSAHVAADYRTLAAASDPKAVNLVWPFWELTERLAGADGRVGVVLPLSAAYLRGPVGRAGRCAVLQSGDWEFGFYDRAPDALFGDDVKQRIALAFRHGPGTGVVRTGPLRRWSADGRADVLREAAASVVERTIDCELVLKIGTARESRAVDELRRAGGSLGDSVSRARLVPVQELASAANALVVAPTAYNWLGVYRDTAMAIEARRGVGGQLAELQFESIHAADAAYAVLVSHVVLWWWRATGDLFHVPLRWLREAPFPLPKNQADLMLLAQAGSACWQEAAENPVAAVNRGIRTVSYKPAEDSLVLARVDEAVGRVYGLGSEFVRFTRDDARRLRIAGRES
jgi:hypothetical protein